MQPTSARFGFPLVFVHRILIILVVVLLGLGGYLHSPLPAASARPFLMEVHVSLGLSVALLIITQLLLRLVFKPRFIPDTVLWRRLASRLYVTIYGLVLLSVGGGYLNAVFLGEPSAFWKWPLPAWGVPDPVLAEFFMAVHKLAAVGLAVLLALHFLFAVMNKFRHAEFAALEMQAAKLRQVLPISGMGYQWLERFAKNMRVYGWVAFWLQLALAFVCALLLVVATSGRLFSPGAVGIGDALSWAAFGSFLLCLDVVLAFWYTRAGRRIQSEPHGFLDPHKRSAFWMLGSGLVGGVAGILISFIGLAMSIALLVAKTVSQPPGIAITDPDKIIRALDVFVLIVNFTLLMAHFIGAAIALGLIIQAARARRHEATPGGSTGPSSSAAEAFVSFDDKHSVEASAT